MIYLVYLVFGPLQQWTSGSYDLGLNQVLLDWQGADIDLFGAGSFDNHLGQKNNVPWQHAQILNPGYYSSVYPKTFCVKDTVSEECAGVAGMVWDSTAAHLVGKSASPVDKCFIHLYPIIYRLSTIPNWCYDMIYRVSTILLVVIPLFIGFQPSQIGGLSDFAGPSYHGITWIEASSLLRRRGNPRNTRKSSRKLDTCPQKHWFNIWYSKQLQKRNAWTAWTFGLV